MQRRRTLKIIKTPDSSIIPQNDTALFFQTPQGKYPQTIETTNGQDTKTYKKAPEHTRKAKYDLNFYKTEFFNLILFIKNYFFQAFLICLLIISNYNYNSKMMNEIKNLKNEIINVKTMKKEVKFDKKEDVKNIMYSDYACIERGTVIDYDNTTNRYKGGYFKKVFGNDPSYVLMPNFEKGCCYSFNGSVGTLCLKFAKCIKIKEVKIFHPNTENRNSTIKSFNLIGIKEQEKTDLGAFIYHLTDDLIQTFSVTNINNVYDKLMLKITKNHGNKNYTCVYKIFVIGCIENT
ncbi:cytoskeletal anchoring at nuclear membrane [Conglomerata obtusa]